MNQHKLGIIVPYRDRYEQLEHFKEKITQYLENKDIDYELIIVEQDNARLFNRGMLLNIGFKYAEDLGCDYVVFHDIDMIPVDVDYSYSNKPLHLATSFLKNKKINRTLFDTYFGGVTLFPMRYFNKINGYSNKYWGWGFEDDDLLLRCEKKKIPLDKTTIKNKIIQGNYLKFNGVDSYVRVKNKIDLNSNLTFFVSFFPDDIICDKDRKEDIYTIFSIPGYDTSISYTSYSRYNFCTFDVNNNVLYINSNIKTNYMTSICVVIDNDNKIITAYQDGIKIEEVEILESLKEYNENIFYLGVGNPYRKNEEKFFRGYFNKFAIYSKVLDELEIKKISEINDLLLNKNFGDYNSSKNLSAYYDTRFIKNYKLVDLTKNKNDAQIVKCEIVKLDDVEDKIVYKPYRKKSKFKLVYHEENGYVDGGWKTQFTRWNQLRFYNEVSLNDELLENDGLSDLEFVEHSKSKIDKNITKVRVGI